MVQQPQFGIGDATFQAVGGEDDIKKLVNAFYDIVASDPKTADLNAMHGGELDASRDKLYRFLCGWMGGPKRYREKYGPIDIQDSHAHLVIKQQDRDQWLWAMEQAISRQSYPPDLAEYLLKQLTVPADRILARHQSRSQSAQ